MFTALWLSDLTAQKLWGCGRGEQWKPFNFRILCFRRFIWPKLYSRLHITSSMIYCKFFMLRYIQILMPIILDIF